MSLGDGLPVAVAVGGEAVTAARLLLVCLIVRMMWAEVGERPWPRCAAFIDRRRADFLVRFLVLGVAFVVSTRCRAC
ncbi:MAG: hypothetical protein GEV11_11890 [Streptosporangiales bacterium]|nr:hypothetical protein [Streptosporangiales bacterium]